MLGLPHNLPSTAAAGKSTAKKITHVFRSGNDCEVPLPPIARGKVSQTTVAWERWPPSEEDVREYREKLYPQILAACKDALDSSTPTGHKWVEIQPGISLLVSTGEAI